MLSLFGRQRLFLLQINHNHRFLGIVVGVEYHAACSSILGASNRQLRSGISDDAFAELVIALREDDRLCIVHEEEQAKEPQIICSLGLVENTIIST